MSVFSFKKDSSSPFKSKKNRAKTEPESEITVQLSTTTTATTLVATVNNKQTISKLARASESLKNAERSYAAKKTKTRMASTPPIFRQRVVMDLGKALGVMGLTNWSTLEPAAEEGNEEYVKAKLNDIMFSKTSEIEMKRSMMVKKERRINGMEEGPNKRRLLYNLQQEKISSIGLSEERLLHEAYQFLVREFEYRLELRLAQLERRRGSDDELDFNIDEDRDKVQQQMMPLTPQPPRRRRDHRRNKTNELTSIYRGEKGNYEKGDFDTPEDPMTNETIHAGLEGLYMLSSPMREPKFLRKNITSQLSSSL